ncbi:MAG: hypothetical protein GXX96_02940 [Planctomycetaceae bacterium]|nr:hypothetical protein [Planctomycetaceae bacterium]
MRLQVPLYKLFVIVAVWAGALGAFSYQGTSGLIIAALLGTVGTLLVMAIHGRREYLSSVIVAIGSVIGAFFALVLLVPPVVNRYGSTDALRDWMLMSVGAIVGGVLFSWARKR